MNGPVTIDKKLELDKQIGNKLMSSQTRNEVLAGIMATYYPGVKYEPNNIGINFDKIKEKPNKKSKSNSFLKGAAISAVAMGALSNDKKEKKTPKITPQDLTVNIRKYSQFTMPNEPLEITQTLDELYIILTTEKWPSRPVGDENKKEKEIVLKQIYGKYKLGYRKIKRLQFDEIDIYKKQIKHIRRRKFFQQNILYLFVVLFFTTLFILAALED